ncbi:MAG: putative branched-chain-amino-acid aminotransferase [Betaproteobacteria bacterium ADurb.Bin341]|nr:MAG: putative branched-chain-amino-acid aminotransferase [Betaproteobacteria bacterium ADurb.Bin341]
MAKNGGFQATATPLVSETAGTRLALLSPSRIDSRHPLRRHKTTLRPQYEAALQDISARPEIFDVLFCNERGEICEGARSTVFVERDGRLLTPPLDSGALPGVLRAELLASGQAVEATLYPADLAGGFWLGNAVRDLRPARLQEEMPCNAT